MNELALFAGAGGGILGGQLLGWRTVCAVEWEQYPASVLCARQSKRMTEAMRDIVKYITKKPGVQRRELLEKALGGHIISPSSLGGSLKALVDQKIITGNGRTTNRKFYLVGESFD